MFGMGIKEMRSKFFLAIILLTPIVVTISAHLYFQSVLGEGPYSQKTRENGDFLRAILISINSKIVKAIQT